MIGKRKGLHLIHLRETHTIIRVTKIKNRINITNTSIISQGVPVEVILGVSPEKLQKIRSIREVEVESTSLKTRLILLKCQEKK